MASGVIGVLLALGMAVCWAATGVALRGAPDRLDVFLVSGLRASFGLLAIIPLVLLSGSLRDYRTLTTSQVLYLEGSVVAGGLLGDICYLLSLRLLGMSRCFPIINSYPLFTVLFSILFLHERVELALVGGGLLVIAGVYLIARPAKGIEGQADRSAAPGQMIKGVLLALSTSVLYGAEAILVSLGVGHVNGIVANSIRIPVIAVVALFIAARRSAFGELRLDHGLGSIALAGVLGWALAGSLWVAAIQHIGASKASIIGSTAPLLAVPLSMIFLGERPTRLTLAGTLLTVVGVIVVV